MRIATHQAERVLSGERRDPDIVLWNRSALGAEDGFEFPVRGRRRLVTSQNRCRSRKRSEAIEVRGRASRLSCTIVQLAQRDDRDEYSLGFFDAAADGRLACEERDDDVGIEEDSTSRRHRSARNPPRSPPSSRQDRRVECCRQTR